MTKTKRQLEQELEREPTDEELSIELGFDVTKIKNLIIDKDEEQDFILRFRASIVTGKHSPLS